MKLHDYAPRWQSFSHHVTQNSWKHSFQNIFLYGVPFSVRSNRPHAKKLAALINKIHKARPPETPFQLLELGAGHGILSRNVLDVLNNDYPDVYANCFLTVSDYSKTTIQYLSQSNFFDEHHDKICFKQLAHDVHTTFPTQRFHFVFTSYLYSSFDCSHIRFSDDGANEVLLSVSIPDDIPIYDFKQLPPQRIPFSTTSDSQLETLIENYGAQLSYHVKEQFQDQPLGSTLPTEDVDRLKKLHSKRSVNRVFNYSRQSGEHLKNIASLLAPNGAYFFSDVCFSKPESADLTELSRPSKHVHHLPVDLESLLTFLPNNMASTFQVHTPDPLFDVLIFHKKAPVSSVLSTEFESHFASPGTGTLRNVITTCQRTLENDTPADISEILATLDAGERTDYYLLQELLKMSLSVKNTTLSNQVAHDMIDEYGPFAFDAYRALATTHIGSDAMPTYAEKALAICPSDPLAYELLGNHYLLQKNYPKARDAYAKSLQNWASYTPHIQGKIDDISKTLDLLQLLGA